MKHFMARKTGPDNKTDLDFDRIKIEQRQVFPVKTGYSSELFRPASVSGAAGRRAFRGIPGESQAK
jgi:hypothetical protein